MRIGFRSLTGTVVHRLFFLGLILQLLVQGARAQPDSDLTPCPRETAYTIGQGTTYKSKETSAANQLSTIGPGVAVKCLAVSREGVFQVQFPDGKTAWVFGGTFVYSSFLDFDDPRIFFKMSSGKQTLRGFLVGGFAFNQTEALRVMVLSPVLLNDTTSMDSIPLPVSSVQRITIKSKGFDIQTKEAKYTVPRPAQSEPRLFFPDGSFKYISQLPQGTLERESKPVPRPQSDIPTVPCPKPTGYTVGSASRLLTPSSSVGQQQQEPGTPFDCLVMTQTMVFGAFADGRGGWVSKNEIVFDDPRQIFTYRDSDGNKLTGYITGKGLNVTANTLMDDLILSAAFKNEKPVQNEHVPVSRVDRLILRKSEFEIDAGSDRWVSPYHSPVYSDAQPVFNLFDGCSFYVGKLAQGLLQRGNLQ